MQSLIEHEYRFYLGDMHTRTCMYSVFTGENVKKVKKCSLNDLTFLKMSVS